MTQGMRQELTAEEKHREQHDAITKILQVHIELIQQLQRRIKALETARHNQPPN